MTAVERARRGVLPRVEPTHVVVALHPGIHDASSLLLLHDAPRLGLVHPRREAPHLGRNGFELDLAAGNLGQGVDEVLVPRLVVQEDDRVMEPTVELPFQGRHGRDGSLELAVARQHYNGGILATGVDVRLLASDGERFVQGLRRPLDLEAIDVQQGLHAEQETDGRDEILMFHEPPAQDLWEAHGYHGGSQKCQSRGRGFITAVCTDARGTSKKSWLSHATRGPVKDAWRPV